MDLFEDRRSNLLSEIGHKLGSFAELFTQELAEKRLENESLRNRVAKAEELEAKNNQLNAELEALKQKTQRLFSENSVEAAWRGQNNVQHQPEATDGCVDIKEYNRVQDLLAKNEQDYGKIFYAHQVLGSKLRYYKNITKEWREYADRWILNYPKKQPKSIVPQNLSPTASTRDPRSSSAPPPPMIPRGLTPSVSAGSRNTLPWTEGDGMRQQHGSPPRSHLESPKLPDRIIHTQKAPSNVQEPSSGDITEGSEEAETHKGLKNTGPNPEDKGVVDDLPIIISERSLKRKPPIQKHDDNSPKKCPVKTEVRSSSPLPALTTLWVEAPHDSLDLDDVGGHIDTPRKRRKLEQMRLGSSTAFSTVNQGKETISDYPAGEGCIERCVIKDEDGHQHAKIESPSHRSPKQTMNGEEQGARERQRRQHKTLARAEQLPISPLVDACPTPITARRSRSQTPQGWQDTEQRRAALASPAVLQPADLNAHILPRTNSKPTNHKSSNPWNRRDRGATQVPALAEDGDDSLLMSNKSKPKESAPLLPSDKPPKVPDAHHRLGTLLNERSPENSLLETTPNNPHISKPRKTSKTPELRPDRYKSPKLTITTTDAPARLSVPDKGTASRAHLRQGKGFEILSDQRTNPAKSNSKQSTRKPSSHELPSSGSTPEGRPEREPLRARSIHRLHISDFKLNPAHSDYAYHESVRKHDEKQSLSGCTDRNCPRCKDIRKFVEHSGYARTPGQDPEETDQRLLLDYLAGDTRRLDELSTEDKKELLLQAKTKQFADRFGKHRQCFGRAPSPVGFWEVDFPTTQEHERNREEVGRREREKVGEMYWEAVSNKGRWVFADE